jgi:RNA polymerase sigma factor (TIGR02999 family)
MATSAEPVESVPQHTSDPSSCKAAPAPTGQITSLLRAWTQGDASARDCLAAMVYNDLRRVAGARLRAHPRNSLSPTDVVNEAFVRLLGQEARWVNRAHFFFVAAEMIRRVLVDHARARQALKRGGDATHIQLSGVEMTQTARVVDVLALDRVLEELAELDARQARIVDLRYFGGLTFEEVAAALHMSPSAVKRDWATARIWLNWRLRASDPPRPGRA